MVRNQIPAIVLYLLIVQLLGCDSSPNGGDNETEEGVEILFNGDVESGRFQADGWTFFSSSDSNHGQCAASTAPCQRPNGLVQ